MKPRIDNFCVVTASAKPHDQARLTMTTAGWKTTATYDWELMIEWNRGTGVVPNFAPGVQRACDAGVDIIACLHDDVEINEGGWDLEILDFFERHPEVGLVGFGGAPGLGDRDIYEKPYEAVQLARRGFVSNMRHAEAHGSVSSAPVKVAVLDGFSQIGRRAFMEPAWAWLKQSGIVHHAYDAALGCLAKRLGWDAYMLPVACHHRGGETATRPAYLDWADAHHGGDQLVWEAAHRIVYDEFKDVLPIDV